MLLLSCGTNSRECHHANTELILYKIKVLQVQVDVLSDGFRATTHTTNWTGYSAPARRKSGVIYHQAEPIQSHSSACGPKPSTPDVDHAMVLFEQNPRLLFLKGPANRLTVLVDSKTTFTLHRSHESGEKKQHWEWPLSKTLTSSSTDGQITSKLWCHGWCLKNWLTWWIQTAVMYGHVSRLSEGGGIIGIQIHHLRDRGFLLCHMGVINCFIYETASSS